LAASLATVPLATIGAGAGDGAGACAMAAPAASQAAANKAMFFT
jgi:hypothetical protein